PLRGHAQLVDDRAHGGLQLLLRHRTLVHRALEALAQLARVEMLPPAVGLDDRRQLQLDGLQRGEALPAGFALATAADGRAVVAHPRVDDPGIHVLAEGAVHAASWSLRGSA